MILPSVRPPGGLAPGAPARCPSDAYLARFPPLGVIGFGRRLPDGATIDGLADELAALRARAPEPLFVCADLEEGAGYHAPGATRLPPARALAEAELVRPGSLYEAGLVTGREARARGIELAWPADPVHDAETIARLSEVYVRYPAASPRVSAASSRPSPS